MRPARTHRPRMPTAGKRSRGVRQGQRTPLQPVSPDGVSFIVVAAVKSKVATIVGIIGGVGVDVMLDSGSSVSLIQQEVLERAKGVTKTKARPLQQGIPFPSLIMSELQ